MNQVQRVFDNAIYYLTKIKSIIDTDQFKQIVSEIIGNRVWITGVGKSALCAEKMALTLACNNIQATFLDASHSLHGGLGAVHKGDTLIAFSNSGKTDEIIQIANKIKERNIKLIVITSSKLSILGSIADIVLEYGEIKEVCCLGLTPTTSFIIVVAITDALCIAVQEQTGITCADYIWNHHLGYVNYLAKNQSKI